MGSSGETHNNSTFFTGTVLTVAVGPSLATPTISGVTASQSIPYGTPSVTLSGTVSAPGPIYPANGETVTVTINGANQNATISGGVGGFSVVFPTATIPVTGSPFTITYAYAGDANLNPAANNTSTTLTVTKTTPTISGVTASQSIPYGTPSVTLTGTVSASGPGYPANGETVTVTINGVNQNATISGGVGGFSVVFPTATLPVTGSPYTIMYAYAGDGNLNAAANNTSTTLTVTKTTPTISGVTASQSIPFGTPSVTLTGTVSASGPGYPANGETVTVTINGVNENATISGGVGGFSVVFPTATIPVSGTAYTITYAYAGDGNLNAAANNTSTTLTVNKATPTISGVTASQSIPFGTPSVTLTGTVSAPNSIYPANGETVTVTINGVPENATISGGVGGFSVVFPTATIPVSGTAYTITYAYAGDGNLNAAANNTSTTLTVNKATPTITGVTASQSIPFGTPSVTLTGTVSAPNSIYPANGETVTVTINGVNHNATIAGGAGGFSIVFPTATIPASATPYTITYAYAGDTDLNAAANNTEHDADGDEVDADDQRCDSEPEHTLWHCQRDFSPEP